MTNLTTTTHDNFTIATITDCDLISNNDINPLFDRLDAVAATCNHRLIINFENVNRCSSYVLSKLVGLRKRLTNVKGRLTLCCCGEQMAEAMKITGLRRLFDIMDTEAEAMEYMSQDLVAWKPGAEL